MELEEKHYEYNVKSVTEIQLSVFILSEFLTPDLGAQMEYLDLLKTPGVIPGSTEKNVRRIPILRMKTPIG